MSLAFDIAGIGVNAVAGFVEDAIENLSTGKKFSATIETNLDPFTIPSEIADDPREKIRLHVSADSAAAALKKGDEIQIKFSGLLTVFKIVVGYRSKAGIQSKFIAIEKLTGKDT